MKCLTGSVPDTGTPWKSKCESSYEKRSCGLIWLPERAMSLLRTDCLSGKFRLVPVPPGNQSARLAMKSDRAA